MTWSEDLVAHMSKDDYLASRMITFDYLGTMYHSIEKMIDNNPGLTLSTDYQNFEIPPTDNHPSLLCHKIIANNIITYIHENDGDYSEEYFNIILNHFGVNVEFVENTPQFIKDEYPDDEYDNDDDNDDDDDDFFEKNW